MKKKVLFGLGLMAIVLSANIGLNINTTETEGYSISEIVGIQSAEAEGNGMDSCDCSVLWYSGCKVSHYGFQCAPTGTTNCSGGNSNC